MSTILRYKGAYVLELENHFFLFNPYTRSRANLIKENIDLENLIKKYSTELESKAVIFNKNFNFNKISNFFINKERYNLKRVRITDAFSFSCNLKCVYCMQQNTATKADQLSPTERAYLWKTIKDSFGSECIDLTLFGGEPFIQYSYIRKTIDCAKNLGLKFHRINAITNGTVCSNEWISFINENNVSSLQITIDGAKEIHDSRRVMLNESSFDLIISNIKKYLIETDVKLILNSVIDVNNMDNYFELVDYLLKEFDVYMIGNNPRIIFNIGTECHPIDKCEYTKESIISEENVGVIYYKIIDYLLDRGASINQIISQGSCIADYPHDIILSPEGNAYNCITGLGVDNFKIANYKEIINEPITFLASAIDFSEKKRLISCLTCEFSPFCNGGCSYDSFIDGEQNKCRKNYFIHTLMPMMKTLSRIDEIQFELYRKIDKVEFINSDFYSENIHKCT